LFANLSIIKDALDRIDPPAAEVYTADGERGRGVVTV